MSDILLRVDNLHHAYQEGTVLTPVLKGLQFELHCQESVAILGASGSGKSTFLQLVGGLDRFEKGQITLRNVSYSTVSEEKMTQLREAEIGFVYQFHHLLPELTLLENVTLPLMIRKLPRTRVLEEGEVILQKMGLLHRLYHKPGELSGGERQRGAIARALIKKPSLILADEPTGNLDKQAAEQAMSLMLERVREEGASLVLVTHDPYFAQKMDRIFKMEEGRLVDQ